MQTLCIVQLVQPSQGPAMHACTPLDPLRLCLPPPLCTVSRRPLLLLLLLQSLKLLGDVSEEQSSCALQLAAQVNFRLDKGQACAEAYDKLKAAGQVWFRVSLSGIGGFALAGVHHRCSMKAAAEEGGHGACVWAAFLASCRSHSPPPPQLTLPHLKMPLFCCRCPLWSRRQTSWQHMCQPACLRSCRS
jgi:hypothetical protein